MCDTVGRIINEHYALFGKNSDRAVNEPQALEYYPAKDYPENASLKCTYITIEQVRHTFAIVLSRPSWIWGGEIGVNEFGVSIGNEAVFTKGAYGKDALIGMDLLRLALERSRTAEEALKVIIDLLLKYNQGGNCGFDTDFHYDNSFLIMDGKEIYVLETAGQHYAYKKSAHTSISNTLSLHKDYDFCSEGDVDFTAKHADPIMSFGAMGNQRMSCSKSHPLNSLQDMVALLSSHKQKGNPFAKAMVGSICMHAGNSLMADQSTISMIVEYKDDRFQIWTTGCSLPCLSLFKPVAFGSDELVSLEQSDFRYWKEMEQLHRRFIEKKVPQELYQQRDQLQQQFYGSLSLKQMLQMERQWSEELNKMELQDDPGSFIYHQFWKKKNEVFRKTFEK